MHVCIVKHAPGNIKLLAHWENPNSMYFYWNNIFSLSFMIQNKHTEILMAKSLITTIAS